MATPIAADEQVEAAAPTSRDDEKQLAAHDASGKPGSLAQRKYNAPELPEWAQPTAANGLFFSRHALNISSQASNLGFTLAKKGTSLGFNIARKVISPFLAATGSVVDQGLGLDPNSSLGDGMTSRALGTAVGRGIDAIEFCTLFGIQIGEFSTRTSLTLANRSVATLEEMYGGDEAVRALGVFVGLVRREWNVQLPGDPPGGISQFTIVEIARATALWASLQAVTGGMYGRRIAPELQEIDISGWKGGEDVDAAVGEQVEEVLFEITDEEVLSQGSGEIITAQVRSAASPAPGASPALAPLQSVTSRESFSSAQSVPADGTRAPEEESEEARTRQALRRYSKLCLGAYGGLGVLFFGIKVPPLIPDPPTYLPAADAQIEEPASPDSRDESVGATPHEDRHPHPHRKRSRSALMGQGPSVEQLAALERRLEESDVANAWSPHPDRSRHGTVSAARSPVSRHRTLSRSSERSPHPRTPASPGYDGQMGEGTVEEEGGKSPPLRAADYGLPFTPPVHEADQEPARARPKRQFSAWEMLTGQHDLELLTRVGEIDPSTARMGPLRHHDISDTASSACSSDENDSSDDEMETGDTDVPHARSGTPLGKALPTSSRMPADELEIPEEVPASADDAHAPLKTKYVQIGAGKWRQRKSSAAAASSAQSSAQTTSAATDGASTGSKRRKPKTKAERHAARAERRAARRARRAQNAQGRRPPRYFVITDHPRKTVVVCLRGTLSIDDIATDLTCEEAEWDPERFWDVPYAPHSDGVGGQEEGSGIHEGSGRLSVHEGFLEIATAMGGPDGPVTTAVGRTLKASPGYELCIVGHSLGAGIGSLLGLIWADPRTCLTTRKSGLPPDVKVKVFGFAPPASTSAALSILARPLIHSFAYSSDAVTRLSLGHIRDIRSAAAWLCYVDRQPQADKKRENVEGLWQRILSFRRGMSKDADGYDLEARMAEEEWLTSLRKTLEANMTEATLFPPGDIFWLVRPDDLELPGDASKPRNQPRLFRVTGRPDVVFTPMLFATNMLKCHLPTHYSQVIGDYL